MFLQHHMTTFAIATTVRCMAVKREKNRYRIQHEEVQGAEYTAHTRPMLVTGNASLDNSAA